MPVQSTAKDEDARSVFETRLRYIRVWQLGQLGQLGQGACYSARYQPPTRPHLTDTLACIE